MRAIREGVSRDGSALLIMMPSEVFHGLSDADVQALVGFLRSQPPVARPTPPTELNLVGGLLVGAGMIPTNIQPAITEPVVAPPIAATAEYGRYALNIGGCTTCHGHDLTGGPPSDFGPPAGPSLVAPVQRWTEADFVRTIQTGTTPEGRLLDPEQMPWRGFAAMFTDDELRAIYMAIRAGVAP